MKFLEELDKTGRIPMYLVEADYQYLPLLSDNKPSKRIFTSAKGIESIAQLSYIKKNKNHSWYQEVYERNKNNLDSYAIFYRGNRITYREMFEKVDSVAKALMESGVGVGDEIPCCLDNTPELLYVMLAASKIGARLNIFGANYDKAYIGKILDSCSNNAIFISDRYYEELQGVLDNRNYNSKVVVSLADSLPENPSECPEYVPELDSYYHYENKAKKYKEKDSSITLFGDFVVNGQQSKLPEYVHNGELDDIFATTYTSGSTRKGFPKAMDHANRSYIVGGIFNTLKLTNTPTIENVRTLAHIHPDSNTDLVTAISDTLMKGAEIAMEPEYSKKSALDVMILNNVVLYAGTTSHLVEAAKQYLIQKRFNSSNNKRILGRQLVTIAVGERTSIGEEKFLTTFLRIARAGSEVEVILDNGFRLKIPFGPLSIGGADTEHGGLFYTLQKKFKMIRYFYKGKDFDYGMDAVPFAVVTALKKNDNGEYVECDYNEKGIIVANSITNMVGYKFSVSETKKKVIRDNLGRDWLSCDVLGYINEFGNPIYLGREEDVVILNDGTPFPLYIIDDVVCKDSKNVLSCSAVVSNEDEGTVVINVELNPLKRKNDRAVINSIRKRCKAILPRNVVDVLRYRIISNEDSFPLTGSGKRSHNALSEMRLANTRKVDDNSYYSSNSKVYLVK